MFMKFTNLNNNDGFICKIRITPCCVAIKSLITEVHVMFLRQVIPAGPSFVLLAFH